MADDRIAKLIRLHARGTITGKELVDNAFDTLAHDGLFDRVDTVTPLLLDRAESEVKEWLRWVDDRFQSSPLWVPFQFGGEITPEQLEEYSKPMRANFKRLSLMVQAILDQRRPVCNG